MHSDSDPEAARSGAAVAVTVLVALAPWGLFGVRHRLGSVREPVPAPPVLHLDRDSAAGRRAGPRELRRLPGIGRVRALGLARWRWARGGLFPPEDWAAVPGIGAGTRQGVREWLAENP